MSSLLSGFIHMCLANILYQDAGLTNPCIKIKIPHKYCIPAADVAGSDLLVNVASFFTTYVYVYILLLEQLSLYIF